MSETIEWQQADGSDGVEIAGSGDAVADVRVNGQQLVQVRTGVRAANARPINRRNVSHRVSFTVTYAPAASPVAARLAIATKSAALDAATADRVLLEGVLGAVTWQLADAALESYEFEQIGTTVRARFAFAGSTYTAEEAP